MAGTTRRRLLLGGTALGLSATAAAPYEAHLLALGAQLNRQARRVRRLRARVRPGGDAAAWSRWSRAVTECAELCKQIARAPAHGLAGIAIKYRALVCQLVEDDLILDRGVRRRVLAFGRELQMLGA
jgi:hypothetical protein